MTSTAKVRAFRLELVLAGALCIVLALFGDGRAQEKEAAPAPAAAADKAPDHKSQPQQQKPGWTVLCDNAGQRLSCKAIQTIVLAKTRQLLLSLAVSKPAAGADMTMLLQLPHGLYNPAGVTVAVDAAKAEKLEIQTCDAKGCYAGTPIKAAELAAMKAGEKLNVVFQDLKKQNITVPVPLKGFDEALKKL